MATYKKRGFKPKNKAEKEQQIEDQSTTAEVFNTLDETANKTEAWVEKNQKYIFIIIAVVAALVLSYLGYNKYVAEPKQEEAMNDLFQTQKYFDTAITSTGTVRDSLYNLVLNGGEGKYGALDIIKEHSGTPSANIANYYAGTAYLNLKKYKEAIEYLGDFSSDDDAVSPVATGAIGDAFVQLNQKEDALGYYEKAAKLKSNEFTAPLYAYKAGVLALDLGQADKALTYFNSIKNDYPNSSEATSIDVFIGKAEASK